MKLPVSLLPKAIEQVEEALSIIRQSEAFLAESGQDVRPVISYLEQAHEAP